MSSSDSASASHIARLVERAEATAGASRASWTLQTEVARVREAHTRWRDAATKPEFGAWTFGLGNRALSGALTAHLESLERGADASAVASTLLEVCFAVAGFEGHLLAASAQTPDVIAGFQWQVDCSNTRAPCQTPPPFGSLAP